MALKEETAAKTLDVRGQICPYPIIEARKAFKELASGQVLEFTTDYEPTAMETLPELCTKKNYPFEREEVSKGVWKFHIKKTD